VEESLLNSMQKRSLSNSPSVTELRRKKHEILKRKIIIFGILFIVLIVGLTLISRIKKININEVKISGNIVIDTNFIKEIVDKNLNESYLWIFPKTNFLIYPQEKIEKDLKDKYKRIKDISIKNKYIRILEIVVKEYEGKYLWCGSIPKELDSRMEQECYFTDSGGYIFDEAPFFSGEVFFKLYGHIDNEDKIPLGNYFNTEIFSKLIKFKEFLEEKGFKLTSLWINNQNEVYFNLSTLGLAPISPSIILKTDFDYEKMAENLEAAVTTEPLQSKLKNYYAKLQYLDLKFGNKVHFKFND